MYYLSKFLNETWSFLSLRIFVVNGIRTMYSSGLIKGFSSKFCMGSYVQNETPEEGWRMHQLKRCVYNNEDEDNSLNILSDKTEMYWKK